MSETKRYSMMWGEDEGGCIYVSPFEHLHGDWVRHGDYARLKAEVERMNQHDDDTCPHLVRTSLLEAENARLKAEVERLTAADSYLQDANEHAFEKRCDELEAEVERLTKELSNISGWGRGLESDLSHARVEISFLKAEVERLRASSFVTAVPVEKYERLRKAGDALHKSMLEVGPNEMAEEFDHDRWWASYKAWSAAKEGKQS